MSSGNKNPESQTVRKVAFDLLVKVATTDLHADDLMDRELNKGRLVGPDRPLLYELVLGTLRKQATLDYYIAQLVDKPAEQLQQPVLILLRLGAYQMLCLDRIPVRAVVHETVELAKEIAPRASGLVNAVLRNLDRKRGALHFPDQNVEPVRWLAASQSLPDWLAESWIGTFGLSESALLAAASLVPPQLTIRTNTLKITREALLDLFASENVSADPCRFAPEGVRLQGRQMVAALPGFKEGYFTVQDEASQLVAHLLAPQPGEQVLDVCAAPGGKATHLAQLMADKGRLVATDLKERKVARIREAAGRLGITCMLTDAGNGLDPNYRGDESFDRILLDAPCSGLGVIRRNPEAKWRLQPADFARFAERQTALLENVSKRLKKGGVLVYATCSTAVEENERVVEDFLSRHSQFVLENGAELFPEGTELFSAGYLRAWPHRHGTDGFFAARIKRIAE